MEEQTRTAPELRIPAFPETILHGLTQQLAPRILECSEGGFIVIFDGIGVSGKSTWGEVINCIEEVGARHLHINKPEPTIPGCIDPTVPTQERPTMSDGNTLHSAWTAVVTAITTALVIWSVKFS